MECHLCAEVVLCVAWSVSVGEVHSKMILMAASGQTDPRYQSSMQCVQCPERKLMQCVATWTSKLIVLSVFSDY